VAPLESDELAGSALRQLTRDVGNLGYHIAFGVLDAADYGAPQHRLRFVMIGSREYPPPAILMPTHGPDAAEPYVTVRDAIWRFQKEPGEHSVYTPAVRHFFSMVPEGKNWRALPTAVQRDALGGAYESGGGKTGFYRRLAWDRPSPTITGRANRKGSALCHPTQTRPLSVTECAALQGFPAEWEFVGAMNTRYMQVGNAVPIALGRAIGEAVVAHDRYLSGRCAIPLDLDNMIAAAMDRLRAAGRNKVERRAA
jgi:DNA (cytosine-5)-methyltransferase 1